MDIIWTRIIYRYIILIYLTLDSKVFLYIYNLDTGFSMLWPPNYCDIRWCYVAQTCWICTGNSFNMTLFPVGDAVLPNVSISICTYIYTQYTYSHCIESERVHLLDDPCIEAVHFCVLNYFIYSLWPMLWHLSPRDLPRTYLFLQVLSSSRLGDSMELQWMGRTLGRWKRWHVPWFQISWCRPGTSEGVPKGW